MKIKKPLIVICVILLLITLGMRGMIAVQSVIQRQGEAPMGAIDYINIIWSGLAFVLICSILLGTIPKGNKILQAVIIYFIVTSFITVVAGVIIGFRQGVF